MVEYPFRGRKGVVPLLTPRDRPRWFHHFKMGRKIKSTPSTLWQIIITTIVASTLPWILSMTLLWKLSNHNINLIDFPVRHYHLIIIIITTIIITTTTIIIIIINNNNSMRVLHNQPGRFSKLVCLIILGFLASPSTEPDAGLSLPNTTQIQILPIESPLSRSLLSPSLLRRM